MRYWPNPAHKSETTEAGPPRWRPDKTKCPPISVDDRRRLLEESIPEDAARIDSARYAFRVGPNGFEWFAARFTQLADGEAEFHGYPCTHVPVRVLRRFRDAGRITEAQYRKFVREMT